MSAILAPNRGFWGSLDLTVVLKFVSDRPRYRGNENFDSKFAITRFIQEVCVTGKGAPANHCSRWQDVNE